MVLVPMATVSAQYACQVRAFLSKHNGCKKRGGVNSGEHSAIRKCLVPVPRRLNPIRKTRPSSLSWRRKKWDEMIPAPAAAEKSTKNAVWAKTWIHEHDKDIGVPRNPWQRAMDQVIEKFIMATNESPEREERIEMEIVVDAYGAEERAMGWYYYLEDALTFPFTARCTIERATSPLKKGDEVEVVAMAPDDECWHDMFLDPLATPRQVGRSIVTIGSRIRCRYCHDSGG
jgi:hypothetical protein